MIDSIDAQLIDLLQANARMSNADLARRLEMAPSAVHQRVKKLEERGVVQGYGARVDPKALERGLLAFVFLRTEEPLGRPEVARAVAALPEVLELHDIAGDDCYLMKVRVAGTDDLHRFLHQELARVPLVRSTKTVIVLETHKETSVLPMDPGGTPSEA